LIYRAAFLRCSSNPSYR